jgi:hypothetical protein
LSEKKKFTAVYQLEFDLNGKTIPFYVGFSGDTRRRETEHRTHPFNPNATDYNNYKYQWIRELKAAGIEWRMNILSPMVEDDEDSEYSWVLRVARNNQHDGITFYNDLPLTNMRRGDLLEEMLAEPQLNTAQQIKEWRQVRELRKAVQYEAAKFSEGSGAARSIFEAMGGQSVIKGGVREWQMPKTENKLEKKSKKSRKKT